MVSGQYGDLILRIDGTWAYAADPFRENESNVQDVINYTVKDGDDDTSTATLTITVTPLDASARVAAVNSVYEDGAYALNLQVTTGLFGTGSGPAIR